MKPKKLEDYLPSNEERVLVQGLVKKSLRDEVESKMDKHKPKPLKWTELLPALLQKYLDEA